MNLPEIGKRLCIYIGESDRWHHRPLFESLVLAAREAGLAGATVHRGLMGYGASSRLHTAKILQLSMDLPMWIEIIDSAEKIDAFLPKLDAMITGGLVTLEPVQILHYRGERRDPAGM
ncbi:MAG: DUF190 domain-containing protein [Verrucomicrobia bacterium]|nr:DUF190 domain-containing protein [Verrucomicrobiota bacterium]